MVPKPMRLKRSRNRLPKKPRAAAPKKAAAKKAPAKEPAPKKPRVSSAGSAPISAAGSFCWCFCAYHGGWPEGTAVNASWLLQIMRQIRSMAAEFSRGMQDMADDAGLVTLRNLVASKRGNLSGVADALTLTES